MRGLFKVHQQVDVRDAAHGDDHRRLVNQMMFATASERLPKAQGHEARHDRPLVGTNALERDNHAKPTGDHDEQGLQTVTLHLIEGLKMTQAMKKYMSQ